MSSIPEPAAAAATVTAIGTTVALHLADVTGVVQLLGGIAAFALSIVMTWWHVERIKHIRRTKKDE